MERNWFKELGLDKVAYLKWMPPRMLPDDVPMATAIKPALGTGAMRPFMSPGSVAKSTAGAGAGAAGAAAAKGSWLSKLFAKGGVGRAGAAGAMIPLGLMLGAYLLSNRGGNQPMPQWAQMQGGFEPPQED